MIVCGTAVRLVLAVRLKSTSDMDWFHTAAVVFQQRGFTAYGALNTFHFATPSAYRHFAYWYPPGFVPWLLLIVQLPGSAFAPFERLVPIAADALLGWLVVGELHARGVSGKRIRAGAALIAFGPLFVAESAVNGQIDAVAFVFVLLAARAWRLVDQGRRGLVAGLLLGAGASVKTVPILFVLAFLPTVKDRRERITLTLSAVAVPALLLLPFAVANADGVRHALSYSGFPGGGGLALLADPGLAKHYLGDGNIRPSNVFSGWLEAHAQWITVVTVVIVAVWLRRARIEPLDGCVVLAVALLAFAVNFYDQYLIWLVPVSLASNRIVFGAVIEAIIVPYLWVEGGLPGAARVWWTGVPTRATVQVGSVAALILTLILWLGSWCVHTAPQLVPRARWLRGDG